MKWLCARGNIVHFCIRTNTDCYSPGSDLPSPLENKEPDMRGPLSVTEEKGFSKAWANMHPGTLPNLTKFLASA